MIWLLGFYMWLYVHRPFEYYPWLGELQIERVFMIFALVCWMIAPNKGWPFNRMHLAVLLYGAAIFISWQVSPLVWKPICTGAVEDIAKVGVFYLLLVTSVRDEKDLKLLIFFFIGATGLYMSHSMLEYINGRYEWRMGISRMIGVDSTYCNPNAFAGTLVFAFPLTLPLWADKPSRFRRFLLLGYAVGSVACILLTGSRAGFAGMLAFGLLYVLTTSRRRTGILLVAAAACIAAVALPGELQNRFLTLVDDSYGPNNARASAEGRLQGFMYGLQLFEQSPLTGTGLSTFAMLTRREGAAHNLYGQVLSEMGLIGAAALLGLVFAFFANAWEVRRFYRRHPELPRDFPYHVSRAITMAVILLLFVGWSGHIMFRYNWLWFAGFQVVTLHCVRLKAAAQVRAVRAGFSWPYGQLPVRPGFAPA